MTKSTTLFARGTGLLVIEVVNSNPNGDPDRESDPRQRPDGHGEISPVSFKRKLRDLVENKNGTVWPSIRETLGLDDSQFSILESRGRVRPDITREILNGTFGTKYWDARVFGNTFLEKSENDIVEASGTRRKPTDDEKKVLRNSVKAGVAHFGVGLSVAPIDIGRSSITSKSGVEEGLDRGYGPLAFRIVRHGVYVLPFFVNPNTAHKTGCTSTDIKLMLRLIPLAYRENSANNRAEVFIRHAWFVEHKHPLGSCSDFALLRELTPTKKTEPNKPSTKWEDYTEPTVISDEIAKKVQPLRDLVEEAYAPAST
jgi:CRISPR-associated protein Csd2